MYIARRARALAVLLAVAGLALACDPAGPGDRMPELRIDEAASGELRSAADTLVYAADATPGDSVRLFLQVSGGQAAGVVVAELYDPARGVVLAGISSHGNDAALDGRGTEWATVPAGGLQARVRLAQGAERASFRLLLVRRNVSPESRAADIEVGPVVTGESFEHEGDEDEFRFHGTAGEEVIIFYRPTHGAPFPAKGTLLGPNAANVPSFRTYEGVPSSPEENSSGRLRLAASGEQRLRLAADAPTNGARVPYEFRVYRVNRAPEQGAAHLSPGDTATQAIEEVGDVDEFTFDLAAGRQVNIFFQALDAVPAGIRMEVGTAGSYRSAEIATATRQETLDELAIGTSVLFNPGRYVIRVFSRDEGRRESATGQYRVNVYPIDRGPESVAAVIAPGQVVSGERIDRLGDVDEFTLQAGSAAQTNLLLHARGTPGQWISAYAGSGAAQARVGTEHELAGSGVLSLSAGQSMPVRVRTGSGATGDYVGAYTMRFPVFTAAPEHADEQVSLGQWVEGEAVDPAGDSDYFYYQGTANQVLTLTAEATAASTSGVPVVLLDPAGGSFSVLGRAAVPHIPTSARFILPRAGRYPVVAYSANWGSLVRESGGYRFRVDLADTRPEHAAAGLARGDTASERLDAGGDVDDFVVTAPAGSTLKLNGEWGIPRQPGGWPSSTVGVDLLNATTGETLKSGAGFMDMPLWTPLEVVVPADGRVRVRLYERGYTGHFGLVGPYRIWVLP